MVKLEDFTVGEIKKMVSKYNKQVKITTSGIKKADLIKKIREHPKLTVTESDKGVNIKVKSDTTMGGKKIKVKKDEKPKVPTITVTEEEKPKKKVIKRGGRYITVKPKEHKADKMDIPKPTAKIRIAPKKEEENKKPLKQITQNKSNNKMEEAGPAEKKHEYDNIDHKETAAYESNKGKNNLKYFTDNYELTPLQLKKMKKIFKSYVYNMAIPKDHNANKDNRFSISIISDSGSGNFRLLKKKKETTKDFIKSEFTKVKPSFKEDTVESLTKAIEHHKKQGNDEIVEKLQKDLKKLKGKGKAEEKPVNPQKMTKEEIIKKYPLDTPDKKKFKKLYEENASNISSRTRAGLKSYVDNPYVLIKNPRIKDNKFLFEWLRVFDAEKGVTKFNKSSFTMKK